MGEADAFSEADEARIASLAEQIAHHSHLYYNLAQPELSDAEFDRLWDELKALDPDELSAKEALDRIYQLKQKLDDDS